MNEQRKSEPAANVVSTTSRHDREKKIVAENNDKTNLLVASTTEHVKSARCEGSWWETRMRVKLISCTWKTQE